MTDVVRGWDELIAHLERTHGLIPGDEEARGDGFVRFPMTIAGQPTRVGVFRLRTRTSEEWVALALKVCPSTQIRPTSALIKNYDLPIGALCFGSGMLIVRQTLPLDPLPVSEIDRTVLGLADVYQRIREVVAHPPAEDDPNPFGYLLR